MIYCYNFHICNDIENKNVHIISVRCMKEKRNVIDKYHLNYFKVFKTGITLPTYVPLTGSVFKQIISLVTHCQLSLAHGTYSRW